MTAEDSINQRLDELSELVAKLAERVIALEQSAVDRGYVDEKMEQLENDHEEITRSLESLKEKLNDEEEEIERDEMEKNG